MKQLQQTTLIHTTPEEVGVDSNVITKFIKEIESKNLNLQSFTAVRHDKVFAQGFFAPYNADSPHVLYSMSKSVTSTAVGFAIDDGLLKLDDKIYKFFPEYFNAKFGFNRQLTVEMLLTMRSDKLITFLEDKNKADWVKQYFNAPFMLPPNSKFNYVSENTFMLSAIVSKVTGKSMVDYLDEKMFKPLGIEKPYWEADGKGNNSAGWGLYMKSEDLAKFFLPYIHNGKWIDSTQLVPEFWVKEALKKHTDSVHDGAIDNINGYGYQFWKNPVPNSFRADGLFGQRCFLFPEYDALVVLNCGQAEDYKVMEVFWKYFPKCFGMEKLPQNDDSYNNMAKTLSECHVKLLPPTPRKYDMERMISGRTIKTKTNDFTSLIAVSVLNMLYNKPGKISEIKFDFNQDYLLYSWKEKDFYNTIKVGLNGEYKVSKIVLGDLHLTTYSQASWQDDGSLKLWIRPIEHVDVRQYTFIFNSDGTVKIINESDPRFQDLVVYYMSFMGMPLKTNLGEDTIKKTIKDFGLPIIEPDFKGKFIN